jgi:putative transcriptional regulator
MGPRGPFFVSARHRTRQRLVPQRLRNLRPAAHLAPDEIKAVRESTHSSQAVMAARLRVNKRTYENWEQRKAKPNAQAAVLIKLVEKYPHTLSMLETL